MHADTPLLNLKWLNVRQQSLQYIISLLLYNISTLIKIIAYEIKV